MWDSKEAKKASDIVEEKKELIITEYATWKFEIIVDGEKVYKEWGDLTLAEEEQAIYNKRFEKKFEEQINVSKIVKDLLTHSTEDKKGIPDGKEFFHRRGPGITSVEDDLGDKPTFLLNSL